MKSIYEMTPKELINYEITTDEYTSDLCSLLAEKLLTALHLLKLCHAQLTDYSPNEYIIDPKTNESTTIAKLKGFISDGTN
jgi:hypothetical protein